MCLCVCIEIQLLREIVTYASVIPETTPWNALFHAYDAILRKKGIDAALDDRCFRFLMRLAEVQGTSWYDRYATLLSVCDLPPVSDYDISSTLKLFFKAPYLADPVTQLDVAL